MRIEDVPARLAAIRGRGPGSEGERRAAAALREHLRAHGEQVQMRAVWVRPDWAPALALHTALAVAGSAISVSHPAIGLGLLAVALISLAGDVTGAFHVLRRLTPSRATQNVLAGGRFDDAPPADGRLRVTLTANLDAGRGGAVYRDPWVRAEAAARRRLGGRLPSMPAILAVLTGVLAALAGARLAGASGAALGIIQFLPTVALLIATALLVDIALSSPTPGANANASGVAAALGVLGELRRAAPAHLDVELLLAGAGESGALGVRALLRERRRAGWRAANTALIALEPCGAGTPRYVTHTGPLANLRLHPQLVLCVRAAAGEEPLAGTRAQRTAGAGAAYAARRRRWPAIAIGALDEHDRPGRAHTADDIPAAVDQRVIADCVELCLGLVEQLDRGLAAAGPGRSRPA